MKKLLFSVIIVFFLWGGIFLACSDNKDVTSEKGAIEKMTEEAGKKMADTLSAPIEKARKAAEKEKEKLKGMVDTANDQK